MIRHWLSVTALLSTTLSLLVSSCTDSGDDSIADTQGGAGGEAAASAGSGQSEGNSTHGGRSGGMGGAGLAGVMEGPSGVAGGDGGYGGQSDGGANQGGASQVRAGGASGQAGGAGDGGASSAGLLTCQVGCATHADCLSDTQTPRFCAAEQLRCVECTQDAHCVGAASGWSPQVCASDDDCVTVFDEVCVDVGGIGRCATTSDAELGCSFGGQAPMMLQRFGSAPGEAVEVCGADTGRCVDSRCIVGCTSVPDFCTTWPNDGFGETCDEATNRCTCSSDDECQAGPQHCNLLTHHCDECETGNDCASESGQDVCLDGRCGCANSGACPTTDFPAGTPLCE